MPISLLPSPPNDTDRCLYIYSYKPHDSNTISAERKGSQASCTLKALIPVCMAWWVLLDRVFDRRTKAQTTHFIHMNVYSQIQAATFRKPSWSLRIMDSIHNQLHKSQHTYMSRQMSKCQQSTQLGSRFLRPTLNPHSWILTKVTRDIRIFFPVV